MGRSFENVSNPSRAWVISNTPASKRYSVCRPQAARHSRPDWKAPGRSCWMKSGQTLDDVLASIVLDIQQDDAGRRIGGVELLDKVMSSPQGETLIDVTLIGYFASVH